MIMAGLSSRASSIIIERLNTGTFGDGVQLKGSYGDIPDQQPMGETDASVEKRPEKSVSEHVKGYEPGAFIGGMGGDIPFPFALGDFSVTEKDSAKDFTVPFRDKARSKPSGGTVERTSETDPIGEEGADHDGGSL
jgi:hypothetical protein